MNLWIFKPDKIMTRKGKQKSLCSYDSFHLWLVYYEQQLETESNLSNIFQIIFDGNNYTVC